MTTDVAILRERWVNDSELSNYENVSDEYNLTVFGASGVDYGGEVELRTLWSPSSIGYGPVQTAADVITNYISGAQEYLHGLTSALEGFDVVHTAELHMGISRQAIEAKREHGVAVVTTVWQNIPKFAERSHYSRTTHQRLSHRNADTIKESVRAESDAFVAVTERAARALETEGVASDRIYVVPIGVDVRQFRPGRLEESNVVPSSLGLREEEDVVQVVFVGRYPWSKGVFELLSSWKHVEDAADRDVHLTMVGNGDAERLRGYANELGLSEVTIGGSVPHDQVPLIFDGADLAVVPSLLTREWQEQYGRVILEAQATGTPVVASEVGGIPEAAGDPGVLVQPGDPYDLSHTLLELIEQPTVRAELGEQSRERIVSSRRLTHIAERIEEVYDEVTAGEE